MCTVTFMPNGNVNFVLTSSRDQSLERTTLPSQFLKRLEERSVFKYRDLVTNQTTTFFFEIYRKNNSISLSRYFCYHE